MGVKLLREALLWGVFLTGLWQSTAGPDPSGRPLLLGLLTVYVLFVAFRDWDQGVRPTMRRGDL